jgi:Fungal Zn(2)-Cys(6) binuclear cluster domain
MGLKGPFELSLVVMAAALDSAPFGRHLPQPTKLVSRPNSSEIQRLASTSGNDIMFTGNMEPSNVSNFSGNPNNQGYQLPSFNQLLNHQDSTDLPDRHHPPPESPGDVLNEISSPTSLQAFGGTHSAQNRWKSFGESLENDDGPYSPKARVSESHGNPEARTFIFQSGTHIPQGRHSPVTYPSFTSQQSSGSHSSFSTSTHPQGRRVLREELVPGRGICYVYDDGTVCPKAVDGDSVNPQWGVTKAGKPRKRLAQACTTCRIKKIKCDPGTPSCIQCQKIGRECRFEAL